MVFVWKNAIAKLGGVFDIYELLPAFICGLLVKRYRVTPHSKARKGNYGSVRRIEE